MADLSPLLDANRRWAERKERDDPGFFSRLKDGQKPSVLWIGCADSRVPANEIIDLPPGEVFVHRNVANLVVHSDLNALSVIEYAVHALGIRDIVVCGHYGCGGIAASMQPQQSRIVDHWIRHVRDLSKLHREELEAIPQWDARFRRMCELNVAAQAINVTMSPVVQSARAAGREVIVHGWIYDVADGILRDLSPLMDAELVLTREPAPVKPTGH
jgi:carbonic anhydrase